MSSLILLGSGLLPTGTDLGALLTVDLLPGSQLAWFSFWGSLWAPLPPLPCFSLLALDFGLYPPLHLLLHPRGLLPALWLLIVSGATCMSDRDLVEEVLVIERRAEELVRDLQRLRLRVEARIATGPRSEAWDLVTTPRSVRRSSPPSSSHDFNRLATEIPPIPDSCVRLCANLSAGQQRGSGRTRAERAWESGYWARFCLEGQIAKPRPSWPLDLQNQYYVVLKAEGYQCPLLCDKAADYRAILRDFEGDTLSHGFPSQAEARVYCQAAGVNYPDTIYRWSSSR